jgi:hypothetical protein
MCGNEAVVLCGLGDAQCEPCHLARCRAWDREVISLLVWQAARLQHLIYTLIGRLASLIHQPVTNMPYKPTGTFSLGADGGDSLRLGRSEGRTKGPEGLEGPERAVYLGRCFEVL